MAIAVQDPFLNFNYLVEIDGIARGAFHEVSGLESTIDPELYRWHKAVIDGTVDRRNGSVVLLDRKGIEVARWNFERAWPSKYTGPSLSAEASDVAIETIELVLESLERVS